MLDKHHIPPLRVLHSAARGSIINEHSPGRKQRRLESGDAAELKGQSSILGTMATGYLQPLRSARYLRVFRSVRILRRPALNKRVIQFHSPLVTSMMYCSDPVCLAALFGATTMFLIFSNNFLPARLISGVMKSRKMNVRLENWVIGFGQQNLVLAFNVLRMLLSILLTAHLLASLPQAD